ncbi:YutD family protein [Sporosarcina soli]|uniref:YutD family protein n=1 Tax=Sporosarcina soli TaxID=334736 RepID=A0ABW0TPG6_9BACL
MITIDNWQFELVTNYRDGYNEEALLARYSDVLLKYDYILGDWGYGQLRLKGFFDDRNQKSTYETKISTLQDYLYEYCNFGCAYFVLKKTGRVKQESSTASTSNE